MNVGRKGIESIESIVNKSIEQQKVFGLVRRSNDAKLVAYKHKWKINEKGEVMSIRQGLSPKRFLCEPDIYFVVKNILVVDENTFWYLI